MDIDFLRSIITSRAWYHKILEHNNILDPHDQNHELFARLWDGMKRKGDGKLCCPCIQCIGFKRRRRNLAIDKRHCREYVHAEMAHDYRPFVSSSLYMSLY